MIILVTGPISSGKGRAAEMLKEKGADDIVLMAGGVIPEDDIPGLKAAGIREIFTPGTSTETIVAWVRENVTPHA